MNFATEETEKIVSITREKGFHTTTKLGSGHDKQDEVTVVYENKESNVDVLVFQYMIEGFDDRSNYEIYDFGYIYNTTGSDLYSSTDPVFETDDFEKLEEEWWLRIKEKAQELLSDDQDK